MLYKIVCVELEYLKLFKIYQKFNHKYYIAMLWTIWLYANEWIVLDRIIGVT